ncbi:MAG TPA: hypothetical protein VGR78_01140, partial [Verrucomicrobiae bacterium]|nr:hypothetical protein [Verrucomicrobiae bacterium]
APLQPAVLQARVWAAAAGSYEAAAGSGQLYGASKPITVILGSSQFPGPAPLMDGLESFRLVPEPTIRSLAFLGAALLVGRRLSFEGRKWA